MYGKYIKRMFDIIISLILMVFILPILIICFFVIKIDDQGPVYYCSNRLGKDGKIFRMYKIRSMRVNAPDIRNLDGSTYNSFNDPRLTRVGAFFRKTSIDELPQIFNVFFGDMSFIGPRPDLPEHINYYKNEEARKLEVLPGITGYNQAYFRNSAEWKVRLKNDLYYIENISFIFDLKILIKTIIGILYQKDIYSNDKATTTEGANGNG